MVLEVACGVSSRQPAVLTPNLPTSMISAPTPSSKNPINDFRTTEDENVKVAILEDTCSLSGEIKFKLTVLGEGFYLHGPCDMWFERMEDNEWKEVGMCPESNFTDEPYPNQPGEVIELSLPLSFESEDRYSYSLSTGTYRYAITYWAHSGQSLIYSPEFKVREK